MSATPKSDALRALREAEAEPQQKVPTRTAPIRVVPFTGERTASPPVKLSGDSITSPPDKPKRAGRSRIEVRHQTLAALKPWEAEGMSRRTWFRRRAERDAKRESPA